MVSIHAINGSRRVGYSGLQVSEGDNPSSFGPFKQVSVNGLPACANIYFAHVYVMPSRQQVMGMMPLKCGDHCTPGIYIAFTADGITFHSMHLVSGSLVPYRQRTSNVPLHGMEWGDQGFHFYEHRFVRNRMKPQSNSQPAEDVKKKWCSFKWEAQDVVWMQYLDVENNRYWFSHRITEVFFFEDDMEWTCHYCHSTGRRRFVNNLTGAFFFSQGRGPTKLISWEADSTHDRAY